MGKGIRINVKIVLWKYPGHPATLLPTKLLMKVPFNTSWKSLSIPEN